MYAVTPLPLDCCLAPAAAAVLADAAQPFAAVPAVGQQRMLHCRLAGPHLQASSSHAVCALHTVETWRLLGKVAIVRCAPSLHVPPAELLERLCRALVGC